MTYRKRMWMLAGLAIAVAAAVGIMVGKMIPATGGVENPVLVLPASLVAGGLVLVAGMPWWNRLDDVQKQGQLVSWFWGSTGGAVAMMIILVVMTGRHSDLSMGALYLWLAQVVGSFIAWGVWSFRGRGQAE